MRQWVLPFILVFAFSPASFADFKQETKSQIIDINPSEVTAATFRIVQSGSLLITGHVKSVNLTFNTPQQTAEADIKNVSVSSSADMEWKYVSDDYGNRLIFMNWTNPSGNVTYKIDTTVSSRAHRLSTEKAVASSSDYLKENEQTDFTDGIRKAAYPYESTLKRAAELTEWVHNYVAYDLSYVGQLKPSSWVLENKKGVCVEYANLLSSLLKLSGIPNRYIVGYAYSSVENKLVGHTWVEILAEDGSWIPLDPTWLEAGYLDATHIKTANRIDANQTELLQYVSSNSAFIEWSKDDDTIEVLDYKTENTVSATLESSNAFVDGYGYIKASISSSLCTLASINVSSCSHEGSDMFDIADSSRSEWICGQKDVYWFFSVKPGLDKAFTYRCPVIVSAQNNFSVIEITVSDSMKPEPITIRGPDTAAVNQPFILDAPVSGDFIFYSPQLGVNSNASWNLQLKEGAYSFYLFSGGSLASKNLKVVTNKEFDLFVSAPQSINVSGSFILSADIKNRLSSAKAALLRVEFDNQTIEKNITLLPLEQQTLDFNITAPAIGIKKITVSAMADSVTSYSASMVVYKEQNKGLLDAVIDVFAGIWDAIAGLFSRLFGSE